MNLITLKTFDNPLEAHLLKTRLESEGLTSFIFDENIVALNPLYNVTVGGIKLKVPDFDLAKAREILGGIEKSPFTDDNNQPIMCPQCESMDIYNGFVSMKGLKGILTAIVSFLLMVFPFYQQKNYRCKSCGTDFKFSE